MKVYIGTDFDMERRVLFWVKVLKLCETVCCKMIQTLKTPIFESLVRVIAENVTLHFF